MDLTLTPDFQWDEKIHGYAQGFWILVEDNDGEMILHHEFFMLKMQNAEEDHSVSFTVTLLDPLPPQYFVRLAGAYTCPLLSSTKAVSDTTLHPKHP